MKIICLKPEFSLAQSVAELCNSKCLFPQTHTFPDGEHYLRLEEDVRGDTVVIFAQLHQPDQSILPLLFSAGFVRDQGAEKVILVAPYLTYMRQDTQFQPGECVTSRYFASLISQWFDGLITVDPHLHRYHSLDEIYSIPSKVVHADQSIARWIRNNVLNPVIIGPDEESAQWAERVAEMAGCSSTVMTKTRRGDTDVDIHIGNVEQFQESQPVLVDDIISTGRTLIETAVNITDAGLKAPICIGVHALLAGDAESLLNHSPVSEWLSCNTVPHISNRIDLADDIASALKTFLVEANL